jgi:hypothetical protein
MELQREMDIQVQKAFRTPNRKDQKRTSCHIIVKMPRLQNKGRLLKAGCQWLTPVIPATQETEIRRIQVQSQPWVNSSQDPILKNPSQK